jgi:phytoene dehydrogenase-like protein
MPDEEKTKVVIIGAGAAGVFTAYLLKKWAPDCFDIEILETKDQVGGHTISYDLMNGGQHVNIDGGAQFFSETAQPNYYKMLQGEGFFGSSSPIIERDVGVTVWSKTNDQLLFRIPSTLPEILSNAVADPLNWLNFLSLTYQAIEQHLWGDWNRTFGDWLDSVPLLISNADAEAFKADIARPLMYQFGLVPPSQLDSLSARFVVYYYVGSLPWSGDAAPFKIYNSTIGLDGILERLLANYSLTVNLNSEVASIARNGAGYVVTLWNGSTLPADGPSSRSIWSVSSRRYRTTRTSTAFRML